MRLTLATRIFLGYAAVLATFGAVSLFAVAQMHHNQVEIRLVSHGYFPMSREAAALDSLHRHQRRETAEIAQEENLDRRLALIRLARLYQLPLANIDAARKLSAQARELAPSAEQPFIDDLDQKLQGLANRLQDYPRVRDRLFVALEQQPPKADAVTASTRELRQLEELLGRDILHLQAALETRIRDRVEQAEGRQRRTGIAIIALSVVAIAVGLLATAISARTLRPVRTLIEGVSRIRRGDYSAQLGVRGDDEISVLAREFDAMAKALLERAAQLRDKQEALLRAEQLAAAGRVAAQVAHEIRNPLSSIGLNVELLEEALAKARFDDVGAATEARELVTAMTREIDRLTEITEHYLKMARPQAPALAPENVTQVLEEVLDFSREELDRARVKVVPKLDPATPPALADEAQLRQVFLNLLRNSREAMAGGGQLTVASRAVDGQVEVEFSDTGLGMSPEVQEKIFEPFFSTKQGGTGLGLAVSRQILQAHGGSIECQSTQGKGTTFVIRLPRA